MIQRNPTLEEQALARIHRLGQTQEVTTVRLYIRDSFEEVHVAKLSLEVAMGLTSMCSLSKRFKSRSRHLLTSFCRRKVMDKATLA